MRTLDPRAGIPAWPSRTSFRTRSATVFAIAVGMRTYKTYRELLTSKRWQKLAARGAPPQRLLWRSTTQREGTAAFARSWKELMHRIASTRGLP